MLRTLVLFASFVWPITRQSLRVDRGAGTDQFGLLKADDGLLLPFRSCLEVLMIDESRGNVGGRSLPGVAISWQCSCRSPLAGGCQEPGGTHLGPLCAAVVSPRQAVLSLCCRAPS